MSSVESCSYMDEFELDLGLGLGVSIGGCEKGKRKSLPFYAPAAVGGAGGDWKPRRYAGTLMLKDFSSSVPSQADSCSSSSSSSSVTKRTAGPSSPSGRSGASQVVGWPPVRSYRVNSLVHHTRLPEIEDLTSTARGGRNYKVSLEKRHSKPSFLVKVHMDGFPIGRKVDMNAHNYYQTLAQTLDSMFRPGAAISPRRLNLEGQAHGPRLLDGYSNSVLTYEDKDGDWMLVGDVPWKMFLGSVKKLRIMRTTEDNVRR